MTTKQKMATKTNQRFSAKDFLSLIKQTQPKYWQLLLGLLLGLIATGIQLAVPNYAKNLINSFSHGVNGYLMVGIVALFIFSAVVSALSGSLLGFFWRRCYSQITNGNLA